MTELEMLREENAHLRETIRQRDDFIRQTFGRYLTDEVLETILSETDAIRIGGERRVVSILFSDIRGSTQLSEQMDPVDFIRMLNHYLSEMIEIINAWQGNILEFVGDAIVVVFGAPRENGYSARDSVACAVAMQRRMGAVNALGIGLGMAPALGGVIGNNAQQMMSGQNSPSAPTPPPRPDADAIVCECGTSNPPNARFCCGCGKPIAPPTGRFCTKCGTPLEPTAKFCHECGTKQES